MAKKQGLVVASPTIVSKEMPERILEKLLLAGENAIEAPKAKITGGNVSMLGFGAGIALAYRLSKACADINSHEKAVLILVDEVQANSDTLRQLIVAYQEMVGDGLDVFLVLAGLPTSISSVLRSRPGFSKPRQQNPSPAASFQ